MRKALVPAFLLVLGSLVLGSTVLREPIARAATPFTNVLVGNTASNPVPVTEKNTDANGDIRVHEQGTASVAQSGGWNVGITGTPTVKTGDQATVIAQGGDVPIDANSHLTLNPDGEDVSAYREVTLFMEFVDVEGPADTELVSLTDDGSPFLFAFDDVSPDEHLVKTYDPAPAKLVIQLFNHGTTERDVDYTLVGRSN